MNKAELIMKVSREGKCHTEGSQGDRRHPFRWDEGKPEKGERIEIRGFGSFVVRNYGGYKGRNPKTGVIVDVPPKRLPFFKVGKELKELVNTGGV